MRSGFWRAGAAGLWCTAAARFARSQGRFSRLHVLAAVVTVGLVLTACARNEPPQVPPAQYPVQRSAVDPKTGTSASPRLYAADRSIPKGGGSYKVGVPYRISGRWYYPKDDPSYDRTGVASWYGDDFHGRKTANGEIYDMNALSAAHTTLPMPSYVWVTNIENGRTLLVRINDRGPYAHDRVIDLSRAAARALGSEVRGLSQVRVRYAGPAPMNGDDRREQAHLRGQGWYNVAQLAPARRVPYARPEPATPASGWWPRWSLGGVADAPSRLGVPAEVAAQLQRPPTRTLIAGAFRNEANAQRRLREVSAFGDMKIVTVSTALGSIFQVRSEPMDEASAQRIIGQIEASGILDVMLAASGTQRPVR